MHAGTRAASWRDQKVPEGNGVAVTLSPRAAARREHYGQLLTTAFPCLPGRRPTGRKGVVALTLASHGVLDAAALAAAVAASTVKCSASLILGWFRAN